MPLFKRKEQTMRTRAEAQETTIVFRQKVVQCSSGGGGKKR
jgi:hypothetical protein